MICLLIGELDMPPNIFISYAHADKRWLDALLAFLTPALRNKGEVVLWDDSKIKAGAEWRSEIQSAITSAKVAVLLVSPAFLSSDFIAQHELPPLLDSAKNNGLEIVWIALRHSVFTATEIERYQAANDPNKPLATQTSHARDKTLVQICEKIAAAIGRAIELKGADKPAVPLTTRWPRAYAMRRPIFDLTGPGYLLDHTYHLLDWNPVFDELIAKPLSLNRGDHVSAFVARLTNRDDVIERSRVVFGPHKDPLVDIEPLEFDSPSYGHMKFKKIAAQISDEHGNTQAWSVSLNILAMEDDAKEKQLWDNIDKTLHGMVNWSKYAQSYDRLLLEFREYHRLVDLVTSKLGDARLCADLGAGTGNATLKLLNDLPTREIWAIESNEAMMGYLRDKLECGGTADKNGLKDRLFIVKNDVMSLPQFDDGFFDGVLMLNVLYAVEDRQRCLEEVARILKPGGTLAISTSTNETNVPKLFNAMRRELIDKGLFETLRENWEDAFQRHKEMSELIHRDTKDDIRRYLSNAGFQVKDWHDSEYVDAVIVAKATKL